MVACSGGVDSPPAAGRQEATAPPPAGGEAGPVRGDWFRYAYTADPQTLNFVRAQDRVGKMLGTLITDSLVQYDERLEIVGRLAESWELSPDNRVLTFHLRQGVRWHDGRPVTSADVAYTVERIRDPASQAVSRYPLFEPIESIETPDQWTVRVVYGQPQASALDAWTDALLIPRHLYEKEADFLNNPQCRAPIGCGPFRFVSWKPSQEVVLEANDDYWDGRPHLDRFVLKIIPQDSTRMHALRLGEIDGLSMTPQQFVVDAQGEEFDERIDRRSATVLHLWYIGWNMDGSNPFFTDRRVRQAMTFALDRPGFIRNVWHGRAVPAASHIPPGSWAHAPGVEPYPFDPDRSRRLLDEAGWTDRNGDGVREKKGREFSFTLLYAATGQTNDQAAAFFQENLRQVGVRAELVKMEFKTMLDRLRSHRTEAFMSGFSLDVNPDPYDFFHSSQAKGGINHTSYSNPEMDRLCEEGRRELDTVRRKAIYRRVQEILSEDQPFTFIFHPTFNLGISRRYRNVVVSPLGIFHWPGITHWWVPREEQLFPAPDGARAGQSSGGR
jgi:peptide/nickel transport system substrate-binding protein